jgi:hypothetical protein
VWFPLCCLCRSPGSVIIASPSPSRNAIQYIPKQETIDFLSRAGALTKNQKMYSPIFSIKNKPKSTVHGFSPPRPSSIMQGYPSGSSHSKATEVLKEINETQCSITKICTWTAMSAVNMEPSVMLAVSL